MNIKNTAKNFAIGAAAGSLVGGFLTTAFSVGGFINAGTLGLKSMFAGAATLYKTDAKAAYESFDPEPVPMVTGGIAGLSSVAYLAMNMIAATPPAEAPLPPESVIAQKVTLAPIEHQARLSNHDAAIQSIAAAHGLQMPQV